jgi:competence protein ComEC
VLWVGDTKAGVEGQVGLQQQLQSIVLAQRGHLFGWVPVGLACGIGWYFTRPIEPDWQVYAMATGVGISALILARAMPLILRPFFIIIALVALGVIVAGAPRRRTSAGLAVLWPDRGADRRD